MAANSKTESTMGKPGRYVVPLQSNGVNVRVWESESVLLCREYEASSLLVPDYGMYVNAQQTLSLDLNRKVERGIRARRAEVVANSRYVRAQVALEIPALVKVEEVVASDEQTPLETKARATRSGPERVWSRG
jgi:hypothetical protein